jgi:hypothetical protein
MLEGARYAIYRNVAFCRVELLLNRTFKKQLKTFLLLKCTVTNYMSWLNRKFYLIPARCRTSAFLYTNVVSKM